MNSNKIPKAHRLWRYSLYLLSHLTHHVGCALGDTRRVYRTGSPIQKSRLAGLRAHTGVWRNAIPRAERRPVLASSIAF
jgi:hypothetical protein